MRRETETRELTCALTDEEWAARATSLSQFIVRHKSLKLEAKKLAEDFKERMAGLSSQMTKLNRAVLRRSEPRMIECHWQYDYRAQRKHLVRSDIGEVVETQTLTVDELQDTLPHTDAEHGRSGEPGEAGDA